MKVFLHEMVGWLYIGFLVLAIVVSAVCSYMGVAGFFAGRCTDIVPLVVSGCSLVVFSLAATLLERFTA